MTGSAAAGGYVRSRTLTQWMAVPNRCPTLSHELNYAASSTTAPAVAHATQVTTSQEAHMLRQDLFIGNS